ncbi:MAG: hypothetical protein EOO07_28045, partial [Chitinophagaceae bacterium]
MISHPFKLVLFLLGLFFLDALSATNAFGQQTFKISGQVKSGDSQIEAATINIIEAKRNVLADSLGYYEVELKAGNYTFSI